jgi:hypothetical protein
MGKIYRRGAGGLSQSKATKGNPHSAFAIHNPKFGQNEQNYQIGDRVRLMLGLVYQSTCVTASELARRWVSDCLIRCANDPACWNNCDRKIRPPLSNFSRGIPACRNEQAKNKISVSSLA